MAEAQSAVASKSLPHRRFRHSLSLTTGNVSFLVYALLLGGCAHHFYRAPVYSMDSIQYMGNALLMEDTDIVRIHDRVYRDLRQALPQRAFENLLGREVGAPSDQNKSRQERAENPYRFGEFLPLFAIRPLYNQTLWLTSKTGIGLVRSGVLISVVSYFALGLVLFAWIRKYVPPLLSLAVCLVLMISPPLTELGRDTTSDPLATLVAFSALYFIFEKRRLAVGFALLLASIYFRTDFVVLAGLTLLACWLQGWIDFWKATVLGLVALASALSINHFAGDYGFKMLYYRNFVGVPVAPGEMPVQFSFSDYVSAFRHGITLVMDSFFLPFLLVGMTGLTSNRMRALFMVALGYLAVHFVILPNWQERWAGLFYLSMGVCAATTLSLRLSNAGQDPMAEQPGQPTAA